MGNAFRTCGLPILLLLALALGEPRDGATAGERGGPAHPRVEPELLPKELRSVPSLLVARKQQHRMRLYEQGKLVKTYVIALGQSPVGNKRQEGDNRTPEGHYRVIQKAEGPFPGVYGAFLGPRWIRLNYPNDQDAEAGQRRGLITAAQAEQILAANRAGTMPPKDTKLGGGIGIHGWAGKWPGDDLQNLTWGCIGLQNDELVDLYDRIEVGTQVIIHP